MSKRFGFALVIATLLLAGCRGDDDANEAGGGSSDGGADHEGAAGGNTDGNQDPGDPMTCSVSNPIAEIASGRVDKVDVLFVVDNSDTMREEQASLTREFPRLIAALTSGDADADGEQDFPAVADLHLGVVSTDMGLMGIDGIPGCAGFGDDGVMLNTPSQDVSGCLPAYPRFLSYTAQVDAPEQTANDLVCIATLGTGGCGFEQPLESALKALWPSVDVDPQTGEVFEPNRITFLRDQNGFGALGHGDADNAGFLRNDPTSGLSAVAIVVVTDEEDCSSKETSHFNPMPPQGSEFVMQDLNLRCFYNPQNLYPLERYINGLKALRAGNEQLVMFAAIVGVPPDLVAEDGQAPVDFGDDAARSAFYDHILADPRMQQVVDGGGRNLVPSCNTERGTAFPPTRIVNTAMGFGENGLVQSICQDDLAPATRAIARMIGRQLGAPCLPRALERGSDGLTGCQVLWELPPPAMAPPSTPTQCRQAGFTFLTPPDGFEAVSDRGGTVCAVTQLAVGADGLEDPDASGWYYDDFSDSVRSECELTPQRIAFTADATPPTGVVVKLACVDVRAPGSSGAGVDAMCSSGESTSDDEMVGSPCLPANIPEGGFNDSEAYLETNSEHCGGGSCIVFRLRGDPSAQCLPNPETNHVCASPDDVEQRVHCTCRCDAPEGYDECACPDGFSCVDVLQQGSDAVTGGYCVRNGTFSG